MGKKIRVVVLYGGRSGEHEISLQSAASVLRNLDPSRFEVVPVGIDKDGRWHANSLELIQKTKGKELPIFKDAPEVVLPPAPHSQKLAFLQPQNQKHELGTIDVVFPVMHGPLCEDGTIQGLLELAGVPYVGSGVLASAIGMDKDVAKRLAAAAGIPVVPFHTVQKHEWKRDPKKVETAAAKLGWPLFVKPANMGSSVGVHKVKRAQDLAAALKDAFQYDLKVLLEKGVNAREIELSVLESLEAGEENIVSVPGEVTPEGDHEFYSYEAKYLDEAGASLHIPAKLTPEQTKKAQAIARETFTCFGLSGMARVDLFLDKDSGQLYLNEVNTIPGFTSISMYPKMLEASGIPYAQLLTHLVELALRKHADKQSLKSDYSQK